jgi:hypothetical protein
MANDAEGLRIDPPTPAPPPPVIAQRAPFLGWLAKQVVLPLTPFIVGCGIRTIRLHHLSVSCFDPAELCFSLAMFCLIGVVAARRLDSTEYREAAFALFAIGVAIFISLFSFSVIEAAQLDDTKDEALKEARLVFGSGHVNVSQPEIDRVLRASEQVRCKDTLETILYSVACVGAVFLLAGFAMRDRYGLGEE